MIRAVLHTARVGPDSSNVAERARWWTGGRGNAAGNRSQGAAHGARSWYCRRGRGRSRDRLLRAPRPHRIAARGGAQDSPTAACGGEARGGGPAARGPDRVARRGCPAAFRGGDRGQRAALGSHQRRGAHRGEGRGAWPSRPGRGASRAGCRRPRGAHEAAPGGPEGGAGQGAAGAPADLRHDGQRGEGADARPRRGARPARARTASAPDGGGGADRSQAARPEPRRRRPAAGRGEPCRGDDGDAGRAAERRHERPDHRPGGPQHPRAGAPHGRRLHHRRHPAGGRALLVRRDST